MTERSIHHATFTIERIYPAPPARVFAAWSDAQAKLQWFACHDEWPVADHQFDFRVGGHERLATGPAGGTVHAMNALYHDIVPDARIVYSYDMRLDERRISVSLVTVEFAPHARGTRLVMTEQGAFLDGYDDVEGREEGTRIGLENLAKVFEAAAVRA